MTDKKDTVNIKIITIIIIIIIISLVLDPVLPCISFIEGLSNFKWDVMDCFNGSKNNAKAVIGIHELVQAYFLATGSIHV